ncbi:hypothetical protein [Lentzea jiangxiensis]|uniref:Excreted virulence factor EspC, type VII ESX diderm n=1 Tax=Lentzea jiangxiensis TaxID=641025 RepID=A0A1H0X3I7_9PSEU|nr:hypothetical protein [Lentzea jiangxiensis]SDP97450.1 hypothetical protein SAMN05421507_13118 [Lentzea jiangxiensis]
MSGMEAKPDEIIRIGEGFRQVGAFLEGTIENSQERRTLLRKATGDDDTAKEIYEKLGPTVDKIEEALNSIHALMVNRSNVTRGLGERLNNMENNIADNLANNSRHGGGSRR